MRVVRCANLAPPLQGGGHRFESCSAHNKPLNLGSGRAAVSRWCEIPVMDRQPCNFSTSGPRSARVVHVGILQATHEPGVAHGVPIGNGGVQSTTGEVGRQSTEHLPGVQVVEVVVVTASVLV